MRLTCADASTASFDLKEVAKSGLLFCCPSSESTSALLLVAFVETSDANRLDLVSGKADDA